MSSRARCGRTTSKPNFLLISPKSVLEAPFQNKVHKRWLSELLPDYDPGDFVLVRFGSARRGKKNNFTVTTGALLTGVVWHHANASRPQAPAAAVLAGLQIREHNKYTQEAIRLEWQSHTRKLC